MNDIFTTLWLKLYMLFTAEWRWIILAMLAHCIYLIIRFFKYRCVKRWVMLLVAEILHLAIILAVMAGKNIVWSFMYVYGLDILLAFLVSLTLGAFLW